LRGRN